MLRTGFALLLVSVALMKPASADETFPAPKNTEPSEAPLTKAEEALRDMQLPEGFRITLFAAEPAVQQPIALATDDRGRLWVAECYTYAESRTNFDDTQRDRIVILEDTDRDGHFDKRTVFWDQGRRLTSVEIGYGGVWVLDAPRLLFIPDRNGDDVPDSEPETKLDGWDDAAVRHNIVNGLRWGPDGWLYGRHGILASSNVGRPGATPGQRTMLNCAIWRYHPQRQSFEVVCQGTTNPWGMDWDSRGQLVFINTVIGHLWHVIPGAYFRRMYGEHFNPHLYSLIEQTADHFHWDTREQWSDIRKTGVTPTTDEAGGGHAHSGMLILQGAPWPDEYQDSVLTVNLHGRRLNRDKLEREGATMVGHHAPDFLKAGDPWFRAVELHAGRFGEFYIADWSDVGECHENDGVHRASGRIYRVTCEKQPAPQRLVAPAIPDLGKASNEQLMEEALQSVNEWSSRHARRILTERAARGNDLAKIRSTLTQVVKTAGVEESRRLRSLWTLHITGGADEQLLAALLHDSSSDLRLWAVTFLSEQAVPSDAVLHRFGEMARTDESGMVLTFLASALQRLPIEKRWSIARGLASHARYHDDRVLPQMIWYGVEGAVPAQPAEALRLAVETQIPLLRQFVARRLTADIDRHGTVVNELVKTLAKQPVAQRVDALRGMVDALRGWRKAPEPAGWKELAASIPTDHNEAVRLTRELSLVFGDGRALDELKSVMASDAAPLSERRAAIKALVLARADGMVPVLQKLLGNRDLAADAINGLAAFNSPDTPQMLVKQYGSFRNQAKLEAISTLVSRPAFASVLLTAIEGGQVARSDVSAFQLRQMQSLGDAAIAERVSKLWPELQQLSQEKTARIAALRSMLTEETLAKASPAHGRLLFNKSCASCHRLFGEGKQLAPDLTGAQRSNINYLLENIVDPSATVSQNFRMSIVLLNDGRVMTGIVLNRSERTFALQTATELVTIAQQDVEEIRESNLSMMPDNLLSVLSDVQIRDLIAYLMSPAQVALPDETGR